MSVGGFRAKDEFVSSDLKKFARVAKSIVVRGQDAFLADDSDGEILRYAGRTVILNVSEAADRLSQEFRDAYPNVSWRGLRGMRNRIAHDYDGINDAIVWAALVRDVPRLIEQLNAGDPA